jgi:hypothetical protein
MVPEEDRSTVGKIGIRTRLANEDHKEMTAKARRAFRDSFPNEHAFKAHMLRLALKSAQARRAKAASRRG